MRSDGASALANREFNVRVSFDENGVPVIGFVQSFFAVGSDAVDLKRVSNEEKMEVAKALGIGGAHDFVLDRMLRKAA